MYKRIRKIVSMLLTVCLLLSVLPGEILATDDLTTAVGNGSVVSDGTVMDESAVIAPETALLADCQILRYVNEEVFREKNHVSRVPSEETLSSYVFQNADGSRTVYFLDEPVKYVDAGGVVREKDLTLKPVTGDVSLMQTGSKAFSGYTTAANDLGLTLPTDPAEGIRLTHAGREIVLIPQGGTEDVTAEVVEGGVNYSDFYGEGMHLRYTPLLSGVKEDIILRAYTGVNTFTFLLNTDGLGLFEENGRYYVAASADDETRFELGDLVTFDAHGRFSVGTTTVETLTPNQSYRLTLTVDEAFLTDENTTYPVTIDPTLEVNSGGIEDATIYSGAPNLNSGNWTYLHTGYYDDTYKIARTLFRFPSLTGNSMYVASDEFTISNVSFHIWEATGSAPETVCVYSNISTTAWNESWTESGVTWNNANLDYYRLYDIGDPGYGNETVYDITDLAKAWQTGEESVELGMTLRSISEVAVDKAFYSTEWSSSTYRPYLVAEFNTTTASLNRSVMDLNVGQTGYLNVTGISGTVTWTSSDPSVATIASSGAVVGHKAGTAIITANVPGEAPMSCTVYVKIPDAVYYITANTGATLAVHNSLDENAPVKLETKSDEPGNAMIRQLWKIRYLGGGYYGIRALYKPDRCVKVTSNAAKLHVVDTYDHLSYFDDNALWKIEALGTGYTLQNCGVTTSKQCLRPSGTDVVTSMFVSGNGAFTWTLTPNTIVPDILILIDKETARPINGSLHTLYEGETATLDDLNLMVSYVSQTKNEVDYYWQSSDSSVAYVNANDEIVVCGRGETTISLHVSSSTNTPMYFVVHSPVINEGIYYIRSWASDLNIEIGTVSSSMAIYRQVFTDDPSQRWIFTYLGDDVYSIRSTAPGGYYLGVENDSSGLQAKIVPRTGTITNGMRWKIEKAASGAYKLIPLTAGSGMVMGYTIHTGNYEVRQLYYSDTANGSGEWLLCPSSSSITPELQETDRWCWVACARMASSKYVHSPISQASAAYYALKGQRKLDLTWQENVEAYFKGTAEQTYRALSYLVGFDTYYAEDRIYSENTLKSLLDAGNVVIVGRLQSPGGEKPGHVYLVYDYSYDNARGMYLFHIYDPWYEEATPLKKESYMWICNGSNAANVNNIDDRIWKWVVTFRIGDYGNTIPYA